MRYSKNALNCAKCPGKAGDGGCPMWWETVWTNTQTGEVQTLRGCGFEQLPLYLLEVVKASNRPAAAIESTRNSIVEGLGKLGVALDRGFRALSHGEASSRNPT